MTATTNIAAPHPGADRVLSFWQAAGPKHWFAKDAAFDDDFRARFAAEHQQAADGRLADWENDPASALALVLLLDQYPRNSFRDTPRAFATDADARRVAEAAVARGFDQQVPEALRSFFYLPGMHSENLDDQERCVERCRPLGGDTLRFAELHRDIVRRFGRFPHRNAILGRESTPAEREFLAAGGFAG